MKTAFVTGANRGLGYGFVEHLLGKGFLVFASARKIDTLPKKKNLIWIELDVKDDSSIENVFAAVKAKTDHLDLLINNAGINSDTSDVGTKKMIMQLDSLDRRALLNMFDVNSVSPILIIKRFLPLLTAHPSFIINISSCRASFHDEFERMNGNYGYRSSKVALNMMTFCSLADIPKNVKTFAVHPGSVRTVMNNTGEQEPLDQARQIIEITEHWKDEFNGRFMRYNGTLYPL